jgi:hypothetical protein
MILGVWRPRFESTVHHSIFGFGPNAIPPVLVGQTRAHRWFHWRLQWAYGGLDVTEEGGCSGLLRVGLRWSGQDKLGRIRMG